MTSLKWFQKVFLKPKRRIICNLMFAIFADVQSDNPSEIRISINECDVFEKIEMLFGVL